MSRILFLIWNKIYYMKQFAVRLKELRTEKGLSIQALSKLTDIGVASICRWENNQADIKGEYKIICDYIFFTIKGLFPYKYVFYLKLFV